MNGQRFKDNYYKEFEHEMKKQWVSGSEECQWFWRQWKIFFSRDMIEIHNR